MAKTNSSAGKEGSDDQLANAVRESAEQIWLAGLGAFAKAQQEGTKVFEALVREGDVLQRRTRAVTEQRLEEVADRFTEAATQLSRQATQSWDRLEQVFEDRVARALSHLGVPSARDVRELTEMLQALNERISELDVVPGGRAGAPAAKADRHGAQPRRAQGHGRGVNRLGRARLLPRPRLPGAAAPSAAATAGPTPPGAMRAPGLEPRTPSSVARPGRAGCPDRHLGAPARRRARERAAGAILCRPTQRAVGPVPCCQACRPTSHDGKEDSPKNPRADPGALAADVQRGRRAERDHQRDCRRDEHQSRQSVLPLPQQGGHRQRPVRGLRARDRQGARCRPTAGGASVEDAWFLLHLLFETIWRHRFLYRDLNDLLSRNRRLESYFNQLLDRKIQAARSLCKALAERGELMALATRSKPWRPTWWWWRPTGCRTNT